MAPDLEPIDDRFPGLPDEDTNEDTMMAVCEARGHNINFLTYSSDHCPKVFIKYNSVTMGEARRAHSSTLLNTRM